MRIGEMKRNDLNFNSNKSDKQKMNERVAEKRSDIGNK